ncbi:hypothetical protein Tco_0764394 [Tanacetum coccineum]
MHNNIMAAGSRDRPPCLQTDDMHNDDHGSYDTLIQDQDVMPYKNSSNIPNKQRRDRYEYDSITESLESEKEAIHLILTGIGDEIYSTVDACHTAQKMWEAIKRLQQGESLNIQDVKTNLFWEFGCKFIHLSHGETIESYYTNSIKLKAFEEDSDPEQAQKDKDMHKNLALIAKNKNVDTTPRYKNDNQTGHFGNERAVNVVGARETKPNRLKTIHVSPEKMLLCKQAEKGVPLQAEQSDWLVDTDEEIDEQELEAHYSYMAKIQEVPNADSGTDSEPLEHVQYDTDDNGLPIDIRHFEQSESISNNIEVETDDRNGHS